MSATQLSLDADGFDNRGGTVAASGNLANTLRIAGTLDNGSGGAIQSDADLALIADTLNNAGGTVQQAGQGALSIHAATLNGTGGTIASNGALLLNGDITDLGKGVTYAQHVTINTGTLTTAGGSLTVWGTDALQLRARDAFDNTQGTVATNGALQIDVGVLNNTDGTLSAAGQEATLVQVAGSFTNSAGTLAASGVATLHAGALVNRGGAVQTAGGELSVSVDGTLDNSAKGLLTTDSDLSISASTLDNTQGTIAHAGSGALAIRTSTLYGAGGTIASNGNLSLHGGAISLRDGTTYAQAIALDADSLITAGSNFAALGGTPLNLNVRGLFDNTNGTVATNGALQLNAQSLTNTEGKLTAAGVDATAVMVAGAFDNTRGTLVAMGATSVHGGSIVNQGGTLSQVGTSFASQAGNGATLTVTADRLIDNSQHGLLASSGDFALMAATLDNTQGAIQHAGSGALTIQAAALNGEGGTIASKGAFTLSGSAINLRDGTTYAQAVSFDADSLTIAGGKLSALGGTPLKLNVRGLFDNAHGMVATNGSLQVNAQALTNTDGTLTAAGSDATRITIANSFDNTGGTLAAMGVTTIHGGSIINKGGVLSQMGTGVAAQASNGVALTVTADGLFDNSEHGVLAGDGDVAVTATILDNTQGTIQHAGSGSLTIQAATLNGQRGTVAGNGTLAISGDATDLRDATTMAQQISIDTGSLTTAGGHLSSLGSGLLYLNASNGIDNTGGAIATNGALGLSAGALANANGSILVAGANISTLSIANAFINTHGTFAAAGAVTLHAGSLDNTSGSLQSASTDTLAVTTDGQLINDDGSLVGNGALALTAGSVSNHAGAIQARQAIVATVASTLDNTSGALIAGNDVSVSTATLLNRDTAQAGPANSTTAMRGIFGNHVLLQADAIDNTRGQIQASDALTLRGHARGSAAVTNASGVIDGAGAVNVSASTLDNSGGQLIQRGVTGTLSLNVSGALGNAANGLIGAEGAANIQAGTFDNSGGVTFARHDLAITSYGSLLNRNGGQLQTNGALNLTTSGSFDNSGGAVDATGSATISAAAITNVGGNVLAGDTSNPNAFLQVTTNGAIDNRGGSLGDRGGDVTLRAASVDNSSGSLVIAKRNLNLDGVGALNNGSGTVYATNGLSFQNGGATLDNEGGQLGAGGTAWLTLAAIANANGGHIQSDMLWLNTAALNLAGGEVDANALHAQLATISGVGRLYGAQRLDAHVSGDYTHAVGQRFESDGVLNLVVDGTLTNHGTLQTQGELVLTAANLINQGTINASATDGSGSAHVSVGGSIGNQYGASLESDALDLSASDITNTGSIVGDTMRIDANTLINGRDLGTALAAVDYGGGFIGAANALDLRIAQRLDNLDGDIYSGGNLTIAGRADGARVAALNNISGRIQGQGNVTIVADQIDNRRRVINTATIVLSTSDQEANSSTSTQAQYAYSDTNPNHQPPAIDPGQVVSSAEFAKAKAYCDHNNDPWLRCIGYPQGSGAPAVFQSETTSTLTQITVITSASADSRIESGGDMVLNGSIRNTASTIAATRDLTINGSGGSDGWASVQNIAWMPTGVIQTTTEYQTQSQYLIDNPRTWLDGVWWTYATSSGNQSAVFSPGNVPTWITYNIGQGLAAVISAGGSLSIVGDVTNAAVGVAGGSGAINTGNLSGRAARRWEVPTLPMRASLARSTMPKVAQ